MKLLTIRRRRTPGRSSALARAVVLVGLLITIASARPAFAGGGPENVFLVVNSESEASKTIANHYIEWRKIPAQNVIYIAWRGGLRQIKGEVFRERILLPTLSAIEGARLNAQIDYLIYSTDFPWRIDLADLFVGKELPPKYDARGSLTGITYLTPYVVSRSPAIAMPSINWYVPGPLETNLGQCSQLAAVPTRAFRAVYLWDEKTNRTNDEKLGQRYLLSTMLGVTYGRGNTVDEILSYLKRSVSADASRPPGTVYYMQNGNVRSATRDKCFAQVATQINQAGVKAVIQHGSIPNRAPDVVGLTSGVASFDWPASGSRMVAGAICDNLTSFGGDMSANASQSCLSEFLRAGAAGASGTVKEPFALQSKFPLPSIHLHYVRGASLAEAFYLSVTSPYQLLIVGDPLCQPWARFPVVTVEGLKPGQQLAGTVSLTASGKTPDGQVVRFVDLYVDGKLTARMAPGKKLDLDTTKITDGHHELRLVGVANSAIETQGRVIVPVQVKNHETSLEVRMLSPANLGVADSVKLAVRQAGADAIMVRQNSREVGRVQGEAGEIQIPAATLGRGPVAVQAISEGQSPVISPPIRITVQ